MATLGLKDIREISARCRTDGSHSRSGVRRHSGDLASGLEAEQSGLKYHEKEKFGCKASPLDASVWDAGGAYAEVFNVNGGYPDARISLVAVLRQTIGMIPPIYHICLGVPLFFHMKRGMPKQSNSCPEPRGRRPCFRALIPLHGIFHKCREPRACFGRHRQAASAPGRG